uniref:Transmembrane protein n=1 Tax=Lactuca sativa TaxID=4236 RepID=A0A9R1VF10_LACSA|nr:hypothetical protein LSAT_V11C500267500 [Lactuca sativa]
MRLKRVATSRGGVPPLRSRCGRAMSDALLLVGPIPNTLSYHANFTQSFLTKVLYRLSICSVRSSKSPENLHFAQSFLTSLPSLCVVVNKHHQRWLLFPVSKGAATFVCLYFLPNEPAKHPLKYCCYYHSSSLISAMNTHSSVCFSSPSDTSTREPAAPHILLFFFLRESRAPEVFFWFATTVVPFVVSVPFFLSRSIKDPKTSFRFIPFFFFTIGQRPETLSLRCPYRRRQLPVGSPTLRDLITTIDPPLFVVFIPSVCLLRSAKDQKSFPLRLCYMDQVSPSSRSPATAVASPIFLRSVLSLIQMKTKKRAPFPPLFVIV